MSILNFKKFNNIQEEKIFKFSEYDPTKYNSNMVVDQIMEWLRSKRLDNPADYITVPLDVFFRECSVDKNKFMTFYNEKDLINKIKNFNVEIIGDNITFNEFKNAEENESKNQ